MRAAVIRRYGGPEVVEVMELPVPTPRAGQALVRVRAASLNPLDVSLRSGAFRRFMPLRFPAVVGFDLAGEIASVGAGVVGVAPGDRVYGRIEARTGGTHAEFTVVEARVLDQIPAGLDDIEAASLPLAGMSALQALRRLRIMPGDRLLVNGASGGVGMLAVQIGRTLGAVVAAVASADAAPLLTRLGAARVLDYGRGEVEATPERFEAIFDVAANQPWTRLKRLLTPRGRFLTTGISAGVAVHAVLGPLWSRQPASFLVSRADGALMRALSGLVAGGDLRPVVDSSVPLDRIREAYERLESGHPRGKIVITM